MGSKKWHSQFLGPARKLIEAMEDDSITDILVNGRHTVFFEKAGELIPQKKIFTTQRQVYDFLERLLIPVAKQLNGARPVVDGNLLDGSRFHIIGPPLAPQGPLISIRKFRNFSQAPDFGELQQMEWLKERCKEKKNILIAGGTGSGKTTLLKSLLQATSTQERIVVLEESRELRLEHPHVIYLEARGKNVEGMGEVSLRTLLRDSLRMRPDRVVLGEVRGAEALELLLALNTGHRGSLCTLHANSARDALCRLEMLVLLAEISLPLSALRYWIGQVIDVVAYLERGKTGRRLVELVEVCGVEGEHYRLSPRLERC